MRSLIFTLDFRKGLRGFGESFFADVRVTVAHGGATPQFHCSKMLAFPEAIEATVNYFGLSPSCSSIVFRS
jgi:hypothetical protein